MKKRIIQVVIVILFCMTLLIVAYNNQKGNEDTVQVSESGNIPVESNEVLQPKQEEYMKDFTTFPDADYYGIVDNSIVSKDLVESIDNYIKNEINANSYDYVRVIGFGYNPTYHESSIELVFDSNEYRYIIVSDFNPNDISIIYNYPMTDFQLSCLGLEED